MPPTTPRIIVADDNEGIYNIVKASLELLGRRPRLIETSNADDAIAEIRAASADLLVTAHSLAGSTNGPILAMMAKRELAALPIIVLADEFDPEMDDETLQQSPFIYLRRPVAPEAVIRAIRVALDGPEAVPHSESSPEEVIPVPPVAEEKLRPIIFKVMRDVGAMAAIMADRNGKVIAYEGAAGYVDRDLLAAALAPGFGSVTKLLPIIGDEPRVLKYYDGEKGDLFGLAVGLHYFIILIFEGNAPGSALGNVKRFGGNAVNEMLEVMGDVAFSVKPVVPPPSAAVKRRRTQEMPAVTIPEPSTQGIPAPTPRSTRAPEPETQNETDKLEMEPIQNFDPSLLDALGNIDLNAAEDLFSDESLSAASGGSGGNQISWEDAMMQGIIGDAEE